MQPFLAGIVTALVGFASAFTVVLAGLRAAGADEAQAASGLLAVCVASGIVAVVLGLRYRMPIGIAWSTPGAALIAAGLSMLFDKRKRKRECECERKCHIYKYYPT